MSALVIFDLTDGPFRSLVGALKRAGGYAKGGDKFTPAEGAAEPKSPIVDNLAGCSRYTG
jgi:hypothetical protein